MYLFGKRITKLNKSKKSGFTLIEVMIAIGVFAVISTSLFTSFRTYTSAINRERDMALESVRIQKAFREIEGYIRASTQDISASQRSDTYVPVKCISDTGSIFLKDENTEEKRERHDLKVGLDNQELYIVRNSDYKVEGLTADKRIVLSKNVKRICIEDDRDNRAASDKIENGKLKITIKSSLNEMRELVKLIPYQGQFRDK